MQILVLWYLGSIQLTLVSFSRRTCSWSESLHHSSLSCSRKIALFKGHEIGWATTRHPMVYIEVLRVVPRSTWPYEISGDYGLSAERSDEFVWSFLVPKASLGFVLRS